MRLKITATVLAAGLLLWLQACATTVMPPGPGPTTPRLEAQRIFMTDGMALPLHAWTPSDNPGHPPKAVILALHGFNDYGKAFEGPAGWWAARGIATYAYDQRGFGAGPHRGLWAGTETMVADVRTAARLIRERYPGVPLYLLGESMGAAVAAAALTRPAAPEVAGAVLVAPAVWARETMPFYQRAALWMAVRLAPWAKFSGRGLDIQASDNIEMLRGLGRDPLVIKRTRVSAMDGLTELMSEAFEAAPRFEVPALVLYGRKDEIIPPGPTLDFWRNLPVGAARDQRRVFYADGWHMLLRDLGAGAVLADIAHWMMDRHAPLPSGSDLNALDELASLVGENR